MPGGVRSPPLIVYVHGGAWTSGRKAQYPSFLVDRGFAVASLDFRSSNEARFPANVHDIKASIRFLRAKAKEYGYRGERIAIVGASSEKSGSPSCREPSSFSQCVTFVPTS